ncbi:hypothetical protein ACFL1H_07305, partial [Nanoarchaeota archaeon]
MVIPIIGPAIAKRRLKKYLKKKGKHESGQNRHQNKMEKANLDTKLSGNTASKYINNARFEYHQNNFISRKHKAENATTRANFEKHMSEGNYKSAAAVKMQMGKQNSIQQAELAEMKKVRAQRNKMFLADVQLRKQQAKYAGGKVAQGIGSLLTLNFLFGGNGLLDKIKNLFIGLATIFFRHTVLAICVILILSSFIWYPVVAPPVALWFHERGVDNLGEAVMAGIHWVGDGLQWLFGMQRALAADYIDMATGGLIRSKVDQANETLGVYLQFEDAYNLVAGAPVAITGRIQVATLTEDPNHEVELSCEVDNSISAALKQSQREKWMYPGKIFGNKEKLKIQVYEGDSPEFSCEFDEGQLFPGRREFSMTALFDFDSLAYTGNVMFIDGKLTVNKSMNLIKEEYPEYQFPSESDSHTTSGPVNLGLRVPNLPLKVYDTIPEYYLNPQIDIGINNVWSGKIKNIETLIIQLPIGMTFEEPKGVYDKCMFNQLEDVLGPCSGDKICNVATFCIDKVCQRELELGTDSEDYKNCMEGCKSYNTYELNFAALDPTIQRRFENIEKRENLFCKMVVDTSIMKNSELG